MEFVITFLEGFISFISPCMLPLLPLYISYFAGGADKKHKVFLRALSFVLGFTVVFSVLGLFAGMIGAFLREYKIVVNIIGGTLIVVFGLSYLEFIKLPFFKGMQSGRTADTAVSAFLFGVVYSVSLTPCIGAFLGSALALAGDPVRRSRVCCFWLPIRWDSVCRCFFGAYYRRCSDLRRAFKAV